MYTAPSPLFPIENNGKTRQYRPQCASVLTLYRPLAGVNTAPLAAESRGNPGGIAPLFLAALYRHRSSCLNVKGA